MSFAFALGAVSACVLRSGSTASARPSIHVRPRAPCEGPRRRVSQGQLPGPETGQVGASWPEGHLRSPQTARPGEKARRLTGRAITPPLE